MLEIIVGCMFSGKTEELARRLRRAEIAGQKVIAFKPAIDDRYHKNKIASHSAITFNAITFESLKDLTDKLGIIASTGDFPDVIGVDEAQFLPIEFSEFADNVANNGTRIIISGLNTDSNGIPFGPIPELLARADSVMHLDAICVAKDSLGKICGKRATKTYRFSDKSNGATIQVGAADSYQARCRACWADEK